METPHFLTLGQAARETGTSKATIFKALKSGRLSYVEKTTSGYQIDPAELFRVFPPVTPLNIKNEQIQTGENTLETAFLKRENELLREQLAREREQADYWRKQATALLTHQPPASATEAPQTPPARPSLWRRLTGKG